MNSLEKKEDVILW